MKKFSLFLTFAILITCSLTAHCSAASINEYEGESTFPVYGKYIVGDSNAVYEKVVDGGAKVTTESGATVAVSGVNDEGLTLVVREINDKNSDAWKWLSSSMQNISGKFTPYEIYFIDENGERVQPSGNATVTISLPGVYTNPQMVYIATDGKAMVIPATVKDGTISFSQYSAGFFAIADISTASPSSPQTGDSEDVILWTGLFVSAASALGIAIICRKHMIKRQAVR